MNERIKELSEQARKALAVDAMCGGEFNMKAYEQKFAELIVRECYEIAMKEGNGFYCPSDILEHFGVEE